MVRCPCYSEYSRHVGYFPTDGHYLATTELWGNKYDLPRIGARSGISTITVHSAFITYKGGFTA